MAVEDDLTVRATRYSIARIRVVQFLVPIAMLASVLARRIMETPFVIAALGLIFASFGLAVSARRGLGLRSMQIRQGVIHLATDATRSAKSGSDPADDIPVRAVRRWTWNGSIARLYGGEHSWKLRSSAGKDEALGDMLRRGLGPELMLRRRGSPRARGIAFAVGVAGLIAAGVGIGYDFWVPTVAGVLCLIGGFAAFGGLSQSVVR